uniref:Transposase n=1 Tax=Bradyrhizobium quebecense TaxID=2748629 RepID=A0ABS3MMQ6_9BRAD
MTLTSYPTRTLEDDDIHRWIALRRSDRAACSGRSFSKLKALLRAAAARTMPDLWQAIANALKRFSPEECQNYLVAAGYDAT